MTREDELKRTFSLMFQAHPWHGVSPGAATPDVVLSFIEIVPTDTVKYEVDKPSGHLKVDRPQRFSSMCPTLYGFIPQTYCGPKIAGLCEARTNRTNIKGDGDPLDICVLSDRPITHGNLFLNARVIGGLLMVDNNEADDKILAVLDNDVTFGAMTDMEQVPASLIDRLRHYFLSYKQLPSEPDRKVSIDEIYSRDHAKEVVMASMEDYRDKFGDPSHRLGELQKLLGV